MIEFEKINLNKFLEEIDKHILSYVDYYFDCMVDELSLVNDDDNKKKIMYLYFKDLASSIGSVYFDKSNIIVDNIIKNIENNIDYDGFGLTTDELRYLLSSRLGVLLCVRGHTF